MICLQCGIGISKQKRGHLSRPSDLCQRCFDLSTGYHCLYCEGTGASSVLPVRIRCPYCQGTGKPLLARQKGINSIQRKRC